MTPDVFIDLLATAGVPTVPVEPAAMLRFAGRLHPAVVHFPIALLLTAGAIEILRGLRSGGGVSPIAFPCVILGAFAAALAAWFGWINAGIEPQSRAVADTLLFHRWIGVATAVIAFGAVGAGLMVRAVERDWTRNLYRGALMLVMLLISVGGYLGGELVHGKGYLLEVFRSPSSSPSPSPSPPRTTPPIMTVANPAPFDHLAVQSIFDARCVKCHGPQKHKASLRLDTPEQVFSGDESMWVVTPGDAAGSVLFQRISLPADHLDRMPADGEALTAAEVETVRVWIDAGAPVAKEPAPGDLVVEAIAPGRFAVRAAPPEPLDPLGVKPADPDREEHALTALRERGAVAGRIAADTSAIDVNLSVLGRDAADADLALLSGLEPSLTWLNLARTGVTDDGLARLASFTALRRLRLEQCPVGDAGVAHLAKLEHLEYLNLYGTMLTDEGLARLTTLPGLKRLYVWQTRVTDEGVAGARAVRPDLVIVRDVAAPVVATEAETADTEEEETAADGSALPPCCAQARAAGGECEHECCVAAAKDGIVCAKCAGQAK